MKRVMLGIGLVVAVAAGAVPAIAQEVDDASPSAQPTQIPVTTESGRPDLYLDMPYYIDGFEPDIVMTRGEEHWTGLAPDDPTRVDRIGGRDVTVVNSVGEEGEYVELFLYDQGDTIWMVQGPIGVFDLTLENLPDPLPAD